LRHLQTFPIVRHQPDAGMPATAGAVTKKHGSPAQALGTVPPQMPSAVTP
jgi:hypothetical protein